MEDKIEVGEFVRTKKGDIDKIDRYIFECNIYHCKNGMCIDTENKIGLHLEDIVKHSSNIIDLINKYDFANDRLIIDIDRKNNKICLLEPFDNSNLSNSFLIWHDIKDIKSIVTKELFDSVKYEVEK